MIQCMCIDDKGRPKEIAAHKWIKKGEMYRVTHIYVHVLQEHIQGCTLYEKPLDSECAPYETFRLSRFAFREEDIPSLIELIKNCNELDDIDFDKLIEEAQLEIMETQ